jgi:hypothetical protein
MKHRRSVAVQLTLAAEVGLELFFFLPEYKRREEICRVQSKECILIVETSQALLFLMGSTVFVTAGPPTAVSSEGVHILSSKQITCIT